MTGDVGWNLDDNGWWYKNEDDTVFSGGWKTIDGQKYYFKDDGYMATGWTDTGDIKDTYFDASGRIDTTKYQKLVALTYDDGPSQNTGRILDVLEKYDYKLPVISNQKINMYSHVIEAQLKISKPITCHVARHTFATLMLTYGVPMEQVQRMLGHKNLATTQIYGKILKKTIETCVKKKLPKLFKKRKKK